VRPIELGEGVAVTVAGNPGPLTLDGTRSYRIGVRHAVLLDPGPADPDQLERLASLVGDATIERVCLSHAHADHSGIVQAAAERFGAPIAASSETLRRLGVDGESLADGELLPIDDGAGQLEVIETPGHSADSLSFLLRPAGWLFTGDTVLGQGSSMIAYPDGRMGSYLASLARLIALRPLRLLPGHGAPVDRARELLEEYRRHRLDRERQIRVAIAEGAGSVAEVRERVYGELPTRVEWAAEASIAAHVAHLCERDLLPAGFAQPSSLETDH
jgi:glyoxylase-like metal-dependent hydrolase (beta-lactamase superfamily II)